jgi:DNA modification methylase
MPNTLYFGDNLDILREHLADASVDLIYLDPPFNSKRDYNLLFKTPKGHSSEAQITAFEDSWHWGDQAEHEYAEILQQPNTDAAEMIQSLRRFLHENDMMAYLIMMGNRLLELHRVLKPTGSLYLHCDPTASHYLKMLLDTIFDPRNFRNEIIWQRTNIHNDSKTWSSVSDTIFFYTKSNEFTWNTQYLPLSEEHVKSKYSNADPDGRHYTLSDMTSPNPRPNMMYEWKGFVSPPNGWRYSKETMTKLDAEGRVWYPSDKSKRPRLKRYLDEMAGTLLSNVWTDIPPINSQAQERLGYPTQKPLALLERIISASSNPGDVVLDPFCGCGTAVHAAQKLGRQWLGIDITPLAINLIEKRMKDAFPSLQFDVHGIPKDLDGAQKLAQQDKYHFQWWACALVDAQPYQGKKKGADGGIDGLIYFQDDKGPAKKIIVSVKGGESVGVAQIRDLAHVVDREGAQIGLFVTLTPPTRPMKVEAVSAGHYHSAHFGNFDKIQILTIEGLLNGTEAPQYPNRLSGNQSFKKARVEEEQGRQGELL